MERMKLEKTEDVSIVATLPASPPSPPPPTLLVKKSKRDDDEFKFFPSGSTLLDLVLGGGWAYSDSNSEDKARVFNIVGDKSSGKTLLAIEAFANFKRLINGPMRYAEAEAAFDPTFAATLGFPSEVTRPKEMINTVEDFYSDLEKFCNENQGPSLYILDSLDALSDEAEIKADIDGATYGVGKAKQMSKAFRKIITTLAKTKCTLGIISQIRDRIGVTFGETKTRSGGHALDFYCSQVVWLHEIEKVSKEVKGQKRPIGVNIRAKNKKNKVGMPYREVDFQLIFGYGVDDEISMIEWLKDVKAITSESVTDLNKTIKKARVDADFKQLDTLSAQLKLDCRSIWDEIEKSIAPPIRKYR